MSLKSILKAIGKAAPVLVANGPMVVAAVKEVLKAVKPAGKGGPA